MNRNLRAAKQRDYTATTTTTTTLIITTPITPQATGYCDLKSMFA
jgi:hypothetical protein